MKSAVAVVILVVAVVWAIGGCKDVDAVSGGSVDPTYPKQDIWWRK